MNVVLSPSNTNFPVEILMLEDSPPNYARFFCLFLLLCIIRCAVLGKIVRQYASSLLGCYVQQEYYVAVIQM